MTDNRPTSLHVVTIILTTIKTRDDKYMDDMLTHYNCLATKY